MNESKFYLNPGGTDLEVFLGPTESKLMKIAWEQGEITVKKALYYYPDKKKPAYTTVMTVLSRLAEKEILTRTKVGKSFIYKPIESKKTFLANRINAVKTCLKQFK